MKIAESTIKICGIREVNDVFNDRNSRRPSNVISILDEIHIPFVQNISKFANHFTLCCADEVDPSFPNAPTNQHVESLIENGIPMLLDSIQSDRPMLVHCFAGISRSTASAFSLICAISNPGDELKAMEMILNIREIADPNELIIRHADNILNRKGAMVEALHHFQPEIVRRFRIRNGLE